MFRSVCENPYKFTYIKIEKILNRPITKFYNSDDVNVIAAHLNLPTSFHKRHNFLLETMPTDVNKVLKTKCKNRRVCMAYCKLRWVYIIKTCTNLVLFTNRNMHT